MEYIRKYWHVIAGVACVAVLGTVYLIRDNAEPTVHTAAERTVITGPAGITAAEPVEMALADIVVHIEGAVNQPGVYTMPYGSRVNDVLTVAGGATAEADLARINLAAFLQDAQQIIIPTIREDGEADPWPEPAAGQGAGGLININTADHGQLMTLPNVGPVLAGNIISHRETNGPFATVDDLLNVPRIGAITLENLRDLVTVN